MATAKRGKTAKKAKKASQVGGSKGAAKAKKGAPARKGTAAKRAPTTRRRAPAKKPTAPPSPILDHIGVAVSDYEKSKAWYLAALAPLGFGLVMEFGKAGGFGPPGKPALWIAEGSVTESSYWRPEHRAGAAPVHVALGAKDRAAVDAFYEAAIAAGGTDHGKPGLRPEYHPGYYAAFVLDLDGNNVEAVHHTFG